MESVNQSISQSVSQSVSYKTCYSFYLTRTVTHYIKVVSSWPQAGRIKVHICLNLISKSEWILP